MHHTVLHQFLAEAEQRCRTLRQKVLSGAHMSNTAFQGMLRSVGGEAAVLHWKSLLTAAGGEAVVGEGGGDDEEVRLKTEPFELSLLNSEAELLKLSCWTDLC
jgi:hypothetical protein